MAIPSVVIDQVRDRADMLEIISGYVSLKKAGANYRALCPFHHEKTPSFMVSPEKQIFHCFGCGEGGNVFNFLIKMERMTFPESVEFLADRFGISIPHQQRTSGDPSSSQELYEANALAVRYFHELLIRSSTTTAVQHYLHKRKISTETVKKFQLGLALDQWDGLIGFAKAKGIQAATLAKAGLVLQKEGGGYYDRFRSRLMFPIFDTRGRAVAFGGRTLEEAGTPKYLNSPETEVYQKGRLLYGLWLTKEGIKNKNAVLLVEGYFDLITLYQAGLDFVVASCGTALTVDQIRLLKRFTNRIIVVYDGDQAGQMASLRGLDLLLEEGCQVRLIDLPKGKDPDDFIRTEGAEAFRQKVGQAKDLLGYKLGLLVAQKDLKDPYQKHQVAKEILSTIQRIASPILRGEYLRQLAERIRVREEELLSELARIGSTRSQAHQEIPKPAPKISIAEKLLVRLIFEYPNLLGVLKDQLQFEDFENDLVRELMKRIFNECSPQEGETSTPRQWLGGLEDVHLARLVSQLLSDEDPIEEPQRSLQDCIRWLKQSRSRKELAKLQRQIVEAQTNQGTELDQLLLEYQQVLKNHKLGANEVKIYERQSEGF